MQRNVRAEVIIIKVSEPPLRLLDLLTRSGHELREVQNFAQAKAALPQCSNPALLIYGNDKEKDSEIIAKKIVGVKEFSKSPLILIGNNVAKHHELLAKTFPVVAALDLSTQLHEMITVINEVINHAATVFGQEPLPIIAKARSNEKISRPSNGLAQSVVKEAVAFSQGRLPLRAAEYVGLIHPNIFEKGDCLPKNERSKEAVEKLFLELPVQAREYVQRVAFVTDQFVEALQISAEHDDSAKTAALLFADGLKDKSEMMRNEYLDAKDSSLREGMAARFKKSALKVAAETGDNEAAEILLAMADCIAGNDLFDNERALIASSIVAADIIAKACWKSGRWNQNGIYSTFSKLKKQNHINLHPKVLSCLILFLAEASNSEASLLLYPKASAQIMARLKAFRKDCPVELLEGERAVSITKITPGMRIARPVYDCEGTIVLESNLALDTDMILRLWQLSAIRPLLVPLVITRDSVTEVAKAPLAEKDLSHSTAHA